MRNQGRPRVPPSLLATALVLPTYAGVAADHDARRICGLSPIYTLLRLLPDTSGRLVRYTQWPDPQGAVTFCAVTFP